VDRPTINEKRYILVYQCEKYGTSIVHTHRSKVFSKADVEATTFTVCCPENCSAPETSPGRRALYIAEFSWVPSFRDRPQELGVSLVVAVNQSHRQFETRKTYYPEMFAVNPATLPKVQPMRTEQRHESCCG
jgi:hypothetical protein